MKSSKLFGIFFIVVQLSTPILNYNDIKRCIIDALLEGFELNKEHLKSLQSYINEEDFDNTTIVGPETLPEILQMDDMTLHHDLMNMLLITTRSELFKAVLLKCRPNPELPKLRCEKYYGEGHCEMMDDYVWSKKCPFGYKPVGMTYCVPNCPSGFAELEDNMFFCQKLSEIQRSYQFYDAKLNPPIRFMNFRGISSPECPDNFSVMGIDFCKRFCPIGWGDMGPVCQKPLVIRRKNEIFVFDFAIDDYLEDYTSKKDSEELAHFNTLS